MGASVVAVLWWRGTHRIGAGKFQLFVSGD